MADLVERIQQLADEDALSALQLVLQQQNPDVGDVGIEAVQEERQFRTALSEPEARREVEARASMQPTPTDLSELAARGEFARLTLVYLAEQGGAMRDDVEHAIDRPAPVGMRDPATLAIIGLVVLALRPTLEIQHDQRQGWKLRFKTEPLKDSSMAKVLGKLLSAVFPGSAGQ
jgi:hypothetical protein